MRKMVKINKKNHILAISLIFFIIILFLIVGFWNQRDILLSPIMNSLKSINKPSINKIPDSQMCKYCSSDSNCLGQPCINGCCTCTNSCNSASDCSSNQNCVNKCCINITCEDSDGGINPEQAGTVEYNPGWPNSAFYVDECIDSNNLQEFYCNETLSVRSENVSCVSGSCANGACEELICTSCPDLNFDGIVNSTDSALLYNCAGTPGTIPNCPPVYDLNGDGIISIASDEPCLASSYNMHAYQLSFCRESFDCVEQGNICESFEVCDGTSVFSQDSDRCCLGQCKLPKLFDWRNRHGENWNTPIRDQGDVGSCSAFGSIASVEASINLYYNQHLNIDLSEQATLSCAEDIYHTTSFDLNVNPCLNINEICKAKFFGYLDEECYPYVDHITPSTFICDNLCANYLNRFWRITDFAQLLSDAYYTDFVIDDEGNVVYDGPLIDRLRQEHISEQKMKEDIIEFGPVFAPEIFNGHVASIVGWKNSDYTLLEECNPGNICAENTCQQRCIPGEITCSNIHYTTQDESLVRGARMICNNEGTAVEPYLENFYCAEDEVCYLGDCTPKEEVSIGSVLCVAKDFGESAQPSRYSFTPREGYTQWIYKNSFGASWEDNGYGISARSADELGAVGVIKTPIIPPNGGTYVIQCRDNDNDGFCSWGLSDSKPSTCPDYCASEQDWDDTNNQIRSLGLY